jgi:3-hydroxyisobutyrate dehydrogenase-like beta-hydroxyacid dehydrogenase
MTRVGFCGLGVMGYRSLLREVAANSDIVVLGA